MISLALLSYYIGKNMLQYSSVLQNVFNKLPSVPFILKVSQ